LSETIAANTKKQICVYATVSVNPALTGATLGLKIPQGGVTFADPQAKIFPEIDVTGNLQTIGSK
jgi:hypothetical protein